MKAIKKIKASILFEKHLCRFKKMMRQSATNDFPLGRIRPYLKDMYQDCGTAKGHYFHQDMLIARRIFLNQPKRHVDVGSRIDGFVAHVASYREIELFDIRPQSDSLENVLFRQVDFMKLPTEYENYCDSISSLHAIEHFGLGRYGDSLDITGHLKGLESIYKTLKPGGTFYFSVPIGPQRVEFNAHRVFSIQHLLDLLLPHYEINFFSYVDDQGNLHRDVELTEEIINQTLGLNKSVLGSVMITPSTFTPSQDLSIVPKFPGFSIPSAITKKGFFLFLMISCNCNNERGFACSAIASKPSGLSR